MTTPAKRRKAFANANANAICALEGFTDADKTPEMIRRCEAIIEGRMTSAEAVAEVVAETKANAAKAAAKRAAPLRSVAQAITQQPSGAAQPQWCVLPAFI